MPCLNLGCHLPPLTGSFQTQLAQGIRNHMSTSPGGYNEFIISVKMHACAER